MRELKSMELEPVSGGEAGEYRILVLNGISRVEEPPRALIRKLERPSEDACRRKFRPIPLRWLPPGGGRRWVY